MGWADLAGPRKPHTLVPPEFPGMWRASPTRAQLRRHPGVRPRSRHGVEHAQGEQVLSRAPWSGALSFSPRPSPSPVHLGVPFPQAAQGLLGEREWGGGLGHKATSEGSSQTSPTLSQTPAAVMSGDLAGRAQAGAGPGKAPPKGAPHTSPDTRERREGAGPACEGVEFTGDKGMGKIRPPHAARPARPRSARHRQIRGGGDGRGKPWPFPGVRPVCPHSVSSPPPSQEGGSGWVEEAVWSPWLAGRGCLGTWELGAPRPAGAWSRASAGGRGTQRSAGRAGRERGRRIKQWWWVQPRPPHCPPRE